MGGLTTNEYFYKPDLGAAGETEKGYFDSALDSTDAALKSMQDYIDALTRVADITAAPYSAGGVGGVGDDAIIQTAIADLSDADSPSTLYFPQGTYLISTTMVLDGLYIWAGHGEP